MTPLSNAVLHVLEAALSFQQLPSSIEWKFQHITGHPGTIAGFVLSAWD
jgi:hypothetical protein